MQPLQHAIISWLDSAAAKATGRGITPDDLQQLRQIVETATPRQRLLYLHTRDPSIYANVIGMAQHEPIAGARDTLRTRVDWPYDTVHDALVAGWQIIHFPNLMAPFDDREIDYVGYEFILQKMEGVIDAK